jgi:hypothetical protein
MDFIKVEGEYQMALQAWRPGEGNNTSEIYYLESTDLINWTKPIMMLAPNKNPEAFDSRGIYRSSIIKVNDTYLLFYSALDYNGVRSMAISYGSNPLALRGMNVNLENIKELQLYNSTRGVRLLQNETTNNTLDVKQSSTPQRFGGLKVGNLLFADGTTDGVTAQEGTVRYNPSKKHHEKYNPVTSVWDNLTSNKIVFAEKNAEQSLVNNEMITVAFGSVLYNNGQFSTDTTVQVNTTGQYRINVGLQLRYLAVDEEIEVYVRIGTSNSRTLCRQRVNPDSDGIHFIDATGVISVASGNDLTIGVKYRGSSSTAVITGFSTQNYLYVERV